MTDKMLICEIQDNISIVTLNRPDKRNALSKELRDDIVNCLTELEANEQVRAVVVTGSGTSFCAGFDLSEFSTGDIQEIYADAARYHRKIYNTTKPLIAAVNGKAIAGGMDLAAMCDVRIVSEDSFFEQSQVRTGITAAVDLLSTVLPMPVAKELCLTGRTMTSEEALKCGFANEIVCGSKLLNRAILIAKEIAESTGSLTIKAQFKLLQPKLFEDQDEPEAK